MTALGTAFSPSLTPAYLAIVDVQFRNPCIHIVKQITTDICDQLLPFTRLTPPKNVTLNSSEFFPSHPVDTEGRQTGQTRQR